MGTRLYAGNEVSDYVSNRNFSSDATWNFDVEDRGRVGSGSRCRVANFRSSRVSCHPVLSPGVTSSRRNIELRACRAELISRALVSQANCGSTCRGSYAVPWNALNCIVNSGRLFTRFNSTRKSFECNNFATNAIVSTLLLAARRMLLIVSNLTGEAKILKEENNLSLDEYSLDICERTWL